MPITVLLADDSEVVRKAIRELLASYPQVVELVGEAVDLPQTIQLANDLKPQVIVMDLHISRSTAPSAIKNRLGKSKMLAISIADDDESKEFAERCGAVMLLDKMYLFDQLVPTIVKTAFPSDYAAIA